MKINKVWKVIALGAAVAAAAVVAGCGDSGSASSSAKAPDAKTYVVATRGTSKPFSYTDDNGNLTGYDVEILKEVEKRNPKLHFEFKSMGVDAAFVAMDAKQVDIIANQMRRNPTREKKYIYTKEVNDYSVRKLAVKKGRTDIQTLDDLKGKKVVVTTNSEFNELIQNFNKTADPQIDVTYSDKGAAETLNLVATGRVDAAGEYEYIINTAVKDRNLPVQAVGKTLMVVPTFFLLRKDPELQQVADEIDAAVKSMRDDGTLKKLSEQYLGGDYTVEPKE